MVVICVFTLEIIDFRPKIIGEKILVPQIFKSALQVLLKNIVLKIVLKTYFTKLFKKISSKKSFVKINQC